MAVQIFTDGEWGLRRFPEIGREELFRFFAFTPTDVAYIDPGRGWSVGVGACSRLCTLPCLGLGPDEVGRRRGLRWCGWSGQLGWIRLRSWRRANIRTDHFRLAARYQAWPGASEPGAEGVGRVPAFEAVGSGIPREHLVVPANLLAQRTGFGKLTGPASRCSGLRTSATHPPPSRNRTRGQAHGHEHHQSLSATAQQTAGTRCRQRPRRNR